MGSMKISKCLLIWLIFILAISPVALGQPSKFKIDGIITGQYKPRIYLFYEDHFQQKDSLSAVIKDGHFHFSVRADLPVLCRIHFGENTNVQEFYVDGANTNLLLSARLSNEKGVGSDTIVTRSHLIIVGIRGSPTDDIRRAFIVWQRSLDSSKLSPVDKAQRYYQRLYSVIRNHPGSKASAYLLSKASDLRYSQVDSLRKMLDPALKSSWEWQSIDRLLSADKARRNRGIGIALHEVELEDQAGKKVNTRDLRNKYVLFDFWASWCHPCRALNPGLKLMYSRYHDKGFEIVGISLDKERSDWIKAIKADGLTWPQLDDSLSVNGEIEKFYDIFYVPASILLDSNRQVVGFDMSQEQIGKFLEGRLK